MFVLNAVSSDDGVVHNHPSGDPTPSRADIQMTQAIVEVAKPLGIAVHDHIIVGKEGHTSLRNLYLNKIRDERARPVVSEAKFDDLLAAPPGASQFDVVLARQVLTAMEALSVEHREVLLLVAVEGLS